MRFFSLKSRFFPTHYPSWGFETGLAHGLGGRVLQLITPHGDLKPPTPRPIPSFRSTHYPSWGFETLVLGCTASTSADSLPLMGI